MNVAQPARIAFASVLLLASVSQAQILQQSNDAAEDAVPQVKKTGEAPAEDKGGLLQVSWPSIPTPKISFPEIKPPTITLPKLSFPWSRDEEEVNSAVAPIEEGASKVTEGTKQAWSGFKGLFASKPTRPATRSSRTPKHRRKAERKQPLWQRLFTPEPEEDKGPQSVSEWMSQPRLDP